MESTEMITINPDWIMWDADKHSKYQARDLIWTLEPEYPIKNIGGKGFIEQMKSYLDNEINGTIKSMGFPEGASSDLVASGGESRLAGWIDLDSQLSRGEDIQEELHVAEIPCEEDQNRKCLCDGWHRIAAAIKHGRSTVPAYVGRKPHH